MFFTSPTSAAAPGEYFVFNKIEAYSTACPRQQQYGQGEGRLLPEGGAYLARLQRSKAPGYRRDQVHWRHLALAHGRGFAFPGSNS